MVTRTCCLEELALHFSWKRPVSELFPLRQAGLEGSWLLQYPDPQDCGKAVE